MSPVSAISGAHKFRTISRNGNEYDTQYLSSQLWNAQPAMQKLQLT